jgi:2-polyprenyl-3-methyl-5-hydroxy-6-metoxy-1,4-benzoquinol methylase
VAPLDGQERGKMLIGQTLQQRLGIQTHYWLRRMCYSRLLFHLVRLLQAPAEHDTQRYWDAALSGRMVDYLGDARSVIESNGAILSVVRVFGPQLRRVLDVGCAGGTLAYNLPSQTAYVGIDISAVAIADALRRRDQQPPREAPTTFHHASIEDYRPAEEFDAIVLSEILYYLKPQAALEQVLRYSRALSHRGVIVVSMKHDAKSMLIFRMLARSLAWQGGLLYQPKAVIDFRVRLHGKSPAFLVGAFRPKR